MRRNAKPSSNKQIEQLATARKKYTPKRVGKQDNTANKENVEEFEKETDSSSDSE